MMHTNSRSRRAFLELTARMGLALPLLQLGLESDALATRAAPKRFLGIFTPHGSASNLWLPRPLAGGSDFDLSFQDSILASLAPLKRKLLVLDGLGFKVLYDQKPAPYTGHAAGLMTLFTGSRAVERNGSAYPESPSIDQVLAESFGKATRFGSFNFGGIMEGGTSNDTIVFGRGGQRIANVNQPQDAFDLLFAGVKSGANPTRRQAEKSVLDFANADLKRLQGLVGRSDADKLESHANGLREIERRLAALPDPSCPIPTRPAQRLDHLDESLGAKFVQLQSELIVKAFTCDITRFATFALNAGDAMPWLGLGKASAHDDVAHKYDPQNPASVALLAKVHRWYAEQVAALLTALDSQIDVDGRKVLDNTLVYWVTDLGNTASHGNTQVPIVLAGLAGEQAGLMKMGRFVSLGTSSRSDKAADSIPHNRLLTLIARCFGLQVDSFGDSSVVGALDLT